MHSPLQLCAQHMSDTDRIGFVLDRRYRLKRKIARGAGGTVFEATHLFTKRTVAVKLLAPEHRRIDQYRMRLLREAEVLSVARHPGIVQVLDAGEADDIGPYLVMELLEGRTLEGILTTKQRLGVPESLHVARQVCHALSAAHARGVIHRDIKPSNIFVARDEIGREAIKVFDFGVARADCADRKLTLQGAVVGTPEYMSPEQLLAKEDIDGRVDIYSVGILLYECLTGSVPFDGTFGEILLKTSLQAAPAIRTKNAAVPTDLAAIIDKAIARNPDERYPTMQALLEALMLVRLPEGAKPLLGLRLPGSTGSLHAPRPPGVPPPLPPGAFASVGAVTVTIPTGPLPEPLMAVALSSAFAATRVVGADAANDGRADVGLASSASEPAESGTGAVRSAPGSLALEGMRSPGALAPSPGSVLPPMPIAAAALAVPGKIPPLGSISAYSHVLNSRNPATALEDAWSGPRSTAAAPPAPSVTHPILRESIADHGPPPLPSRAQPGAAEQLPYANSWSSLDATSDSRRRFGRAPYITPVRILRADQKKLDGHSEDISAGGILVVLSGSFSANEIVKARFALPLSGVIVEVSAYTKWVRTARGIEAIGLQFTALSSEMKNEIERYVQVMGGD